MNSVSTQDLLELAGLVAGGEVTPVLDRSCSLSDSSQAVQYVEEGHALGKVVIEVSRPNAGHGYDRHRSLVE